MEEQNKVSDAQKAAQRKYDQKTKNITIKYTPANMDEYEQLKSYLKRTGDNANNFIKGLVKDFFDKGRDKTTPKILSPVDKKRDEGITWCPYSFIDRENVQILFDLFGERTMKKVLDKYFCIFEDDVDSIFEDRGCEMDEWIQSVRKRIDGYTDETGLTWDNDEGLITGESEDALKLLLDDMQKEL